MEYKIPHVSIKVAKEIQYPFNRADYYCIKTGQLCENIPCGECLFDTCTWNNNKEHQLIEWENKNEQ